MTGYCLSWDNQVQEHVCEDFTHTKSREQVKHTMRKLLTSPKTGKIAEKSHIDGLTSRIQKLKEVIETKGRARIKGSSLFFVCARDYYGEFNVEKVKIASVYLIDMGHMDVF